MNEILKVKYSVKYSLIYSVKCSKLATQGEIAKWTTQSEILKVKLKYSVKYSTLKLYLQFLLVSGKIFELTWEKHTKTKRLVSIIILFSYYTARIRSDHKVSTP
jgi:hypothetical protein